jgi:3-hydroxybutyryl-CoA dehydrogenase
LTESTGGWLVMITCLLGHNTEGIKESNTMDIIKVGVIGCGIMGAGIAQTCAQFGYQVVSMDVTEEIIKKGLSTIASILKRNVDKEKISQLDMDSILERIKGTTNVNDFADCGLVIEAATEDLALKKTIFAQLDQICPTQTILATNTSVLSVTEIGASTKRPHKVLGLHFAQPVPIMKVVEIVQTVATDEATMATALGFLHSIGKEAVIAKDTPGFISNRSTSIFLLNAIRMVEEGLGTPEDIDKIHTGGLGHPMGPLALLDLMGLDTVFRGASAIYEETKDPAFNPPILMRRMVALGWHGRKTGKGFYTY